eukprot:3357228-Rhodomonas_salina.2
MEVCSYEATEGSSAGKSHKSFRPPVTSPDPQRKLLPPQFHVETGRRSMLCSCRDPDPCDSVLVGFKTKRGLFLRS